MRTISILFLLVLLAACQAPTEDNTIPADLEGKQALLRAERVKLKAITERIDSIEAAIVAQDPSFGVKPTLVAVRTIQPGNFSDYASIQATVRPAETAFASAQLPGSIQSLRVKEGDYVRSGQLIATINVEDITSQRAELETAAELAKTVYERQQRLWDQKIGSEIQYLEAKNSYERLQKSLASFDATLNKKNVYAPISGTVETVNMRAGETTNPGMPIITILSTNDLDVVADAPEEFLTKVRRGERVKVRVPALETEFSASITRIGKTVDPANRTFEVEIKVPSSQTKVLKANLLAEVEVLKNEMKNVIVISQDLIQREISGQRFVFIVGQDQEGQQIARKVYVETGASFNNQAIIESGLTPGDQVVTRGARGLSDRQIISLTQESNG
ncbi:MAG: efflux RND transporter periplasmic adaptor subunit [Bacteroidota bacterium]